MTREFLRSPFVAFCLAALLVMLYPVLVFPKGELTMLVNAHYTPFLDVFFKYLTNLGDGALMAVLLVVLLFYSYKLSILTVFSIIFQAIVVSIFKRWLFEGLPRPTALIQDFDWHFVDGVAVHGSNTFPSGHTTTAFALFALLVVIIGSRRYLLSLAFFMAAFLTGFSRVYLLQHFVVDAYFGAIFGILSVICSLWVMEKIFSDQKLADLNQKSLRSLFNKKKP